MPRPISRPCLAVITDRTLLPSGWALAQAVSAAVTGGVDMVLFQEADLPPVHRKTVCEFLVDGIRGRADLIVAESVILFSQVNAQGAHLHSNVASIPAVRESVGPESLIGFTAQTLEEASDAEKLGADYLLVCLNWAEPDAALATLTKYVGATYLPIMAGADTPLGHVGACMASGASGVAVIARAMAGEHAAKEMQLYRDALDATITIQSGGVGNV